MTEGLFSIADLLQMTACLKPLALGHCTMGELKQGQAFGPCDPTVHTKCLFLD